MEHEVPSLAMEDVNVTILTLEEAQARLPALIHALTLENEIVITEKDLPVARLVKPRTEKAEPIPGRGKGTLTILVEDDGHLEDFKEYLP